MHPIKLKNWKLIRMVSRQNGWLIGIFDGVLSFSSFDQLETSNRKRIRECSKLESLIQARSKALTVKGFYWDLFNEPVPYRSFGITSAGERRLWRVWQISKVLVAATSASVGLICRLNRLQFCVTSTHHAERANHSVKVGEHWRAQLTWLKITLWNDILASQGIDWESIENRR